MSKVDGFSKYLLDKSIGNLYVKIDHVEQF